MSKINDGIWNIAYKKNNFIIRDAGLYVRWFYYATLVLTLLIFVFRHTTVRTFFLSLLCGVLLTIFTSMMMAFTHWDTRAFLGSLIGYTLLFFVGSIFTFSLTKRSVVNGILINLFVFIIPLLPLLLVGFMYELKKDEIYQQTATYHAPAWEQYFMYAEIGGAVLLLVLLATYINKLYRRWYALPEN